MTKIYCAIIETYVQGPLCPIKDSPCVWAHRDTKICKYKVERGNLTPQEIAHLVGVSAPTEIEVQELTAKIKQAVQADLLD